VPDLEQPKQKSRKPTIIRVFGFILTGIIWFSVAIVALVMLALGACYVSALK
jgi:hypothetical protein